MPNSSVQRNRPQSPNIQIYRPQLTSVLSIANRISGVAVSFAALGLVIWLIAAAAGPHSYAAVQDTLSSAIGQVVLFAMTLAFFFHLCAGIRHLAWDAGYGFELRTIYASGWLVVVATVLLTVVAWIAALLMRA